jgi:tetratricopeptide (TPR) repeat protein
MLTYIVISLFAVSAWAYEPESDVSSLQQSWAKANYHLSGDEQKQAFEDLLTLSEALTQQHPDQAELWIWKGIVQSSYAGVKGGLGALGLAKKAKKSLEKALELDDSALQGSAYTSLGTLFHKVPGWPLGFGDDDEAKLLLEKALQINEFGIDPNYFYAEFLFDHKDYKGAEVYLNKALQAPPRQQRPLADEARRKEINSLLSQVTKKKEKHT